MTSLPQQVTNFGTYYRTTETAILCYHGTTVFSAQVAVRCACQAVQSWTSCLHSWTFPNTYISQSPPCCFWLQRLLGCSICLLCQAVQSWTSCLHSWTCPNIYISRSPSCCFWMQRLLCCSICSLCQAVQSWTLCLHSKAELHACIAAPHSTHTCHHACVAGPDR